MATRKFDLDYDDKNLYAMVLVQALSDLTCLNVDKYNDDSSWWPAKQSSFNKDVIARNESLSLFFSGGEWRRHLEFLCSACDVDMLGVIALASKLKGCVTYVSIDTLLGGLYND